jgi:hypothetical protein
MYLQKTSATGSGMLLTLFVKDKAEIDNRIDRKIKWIEK